MPTFVVLAHEHPVLLARLLRILSPYPTLLTLDEDASTDEFSEPLAALPPHRVLRREMHWGGITIVRATLDAYTQAVKITPDGDYVVLLSGTSYPRRPISDLVSFLAQADGGQFAHSYWLADLPKDTKRHYTRNWYMDNFQFPGGRLVRGALHLLAADHNATSTEGIAYGSQWTALTTEAIHWLLKNADTPEVWRKFKRSFAADELLIPSLLAQSQLPGTRPERVDELALDQWDPVETGGIFLDGNLHAIPKDLRVPWRDCEACNKLGKSKFFIRKVMPGPSDRLLDYLDDQCLGR